MESFSTKDASSAGSAERGFPSKLIIITEMILRIWRLVLELIKHDDLNNAIGRRLVSELFASFIRKILQSKSIS